MGSIEAGGPMARMAAIEGDIKVAKQLEKAGVEIGNIASIEAALQFLQKNSPGNPDLKINVKDNETGRTAPVSFKAEYNALSELMNTYAKYVADKTYKTRDPIWTLEEKMVRTAKEILTKAGLSEK